MALKWAECYRHLLAAYARLASGVLGQESKNMAARFESIGDGTAPVVAEFDALFVNPGFDTLGLEILADTLDQFAAGLIVAVA